jgi:hypothetical protein
MSTANTYSPLSQSTAINEEPEIAFEESVPSDGPDPEGERMIEELGQLIGREKERRKDSLANGEPLPRQFPVS